MVSGSARSFSTSSGSMVASRATGKSRPFSEQSASYNRVDCESTWQLRDWLLQRQREAGHRLPAGDRQPGGQGEDRGDQGRRGSWRIGC